MNWTNLNFNQMEAKDKVLDTLRKSDQPLKGGEIAERSGLDKKEVDKAIKVLKTEGVIDSPKRCFYTAK
jgi:biotin operon repressor